MVCPMRPSLFECFREYATGFLSFFASFGALVGNHGFGGGENYRP